MPVSAPITITERKKRCAPSCWSAYATGASAAFPDVNVVYFIIPRSTTATPTYSNVQMISEAMIPNGRSRCGLLHSLAAGETEAKPTDEQNKIEPPGTIHAKRQRTTG